MPNSDHPPRPIVVEDRSPAADARQCSPSAARNRGPILEVLTRVLPKKGIVLEIGSGTGEHAVCFAKGVVTLSEIGRIWTINHQAKSLKSLASILAVVGKFRSV
jgi:predicted O-methyltransferase YrrM